MAEQQKPSLTPHRDAVERAIAELGAGKTFNRPTQISIDVGHAIHRTLADARDRGANDDDLLTFAPSILEVAAKAILDHFHLPAGDHNVRALLVRAMDPPVKPFRTEGRAEVVKIVAGGRA